jgi:hypothetical protein
MCALVGPGGWVDDSSVRSLEEWAKQPATDPAPALAAWVLSQCGETFRDSAGGIKQVLSAAKARTKAEDSSHVLFALSICQLDPKETQILREVLASLGSDGWTHDADGNVSIVAPRMQPALVQAIEGLLEDSDPRVVRGSMRILSHVGLGSINAGRRMIGIIESHASEDLKVEAARTLGYVAPCSQLREIETLLKTEKSQAVREQLQRTIKVMNLDEYAPS